MHEIYITFESTFGYIYNENEFKTTIAFKQMKDLKNCFPDVLFGTMERLLRIEAWDARMSGGRHH